MGGTGRGYARLGWVLSLSEGNLRARKVGKADFVSLYLATFIQRAAFDRHRLHRGGGIRGVLLAWAGNGVLGARCRAAHSVGRQFADELGGEFVHRFGGGDLLPDSIAALPADHGNWAHVKVTLAGCDGDDRLDYLCRAHAFQCRPSVRFSSRRVYNVPRLFHRPGRGNADCGLRLLGLLQRLLSGRRNKRSGPKYSPGFTAFYSVGGRSIHDDEHLHSGGGAMARDGAGGTEQSWLVCCLAVYAKDLWGCGGADGDSISNVDSICLGVLSDAGIFARTLRRGAGWKLFPGVRQSAP